MTSNNNNEYESRRKSPINGNADNNSLKPRIRRTAPTNHIAKTSKSAQPEPQTKKNNGNDHKGNNSNGNNGNGNGELTPKQAKFVDEYLIDLNATQAAIRAKYAPKSAESKASQLLSLIKVQKAIQKRRDELSIKAQISQEWVLERYKRLVEYHLDDIYDETGKLKSFDQIPKNALYAIQGFKNLNNKSTSEGKYGSKVSETLLQEIKLPDKRGVLDSLARHLGMFADEGQGGNKFNFNAPVQINVGWEDA